MSLFNGISVANVYVRNWQQARKFYAETLEWPVVYSSDEVGWEEYGFDKATHFAINRLDEKDPQPDGGHSSHMIIFHVNNVAETTAALRARGVRCDDPVHIPGVVLYGTFYDPEGNRFQFVSDET